MKEVRTYITEAQWLGDLYLDQVRHVRVERFIVPGPLADVGSWVRNDVHSGAAGNPV